MRAIIALCLCLSVVTTGAFADDYRGKDALRQVAFCGGLISRMGAILTMYPPKGATQSQLDGAIKVAKTSSAVLFAYVENHQQEAGLSDEDASASATRGIDVASSLYLAQDSELNSLFRLCLELGVATHSQDESLLRTAFAAAETDIGPLLPP